MRTRTLRIGRIVIDAPLVGGLPPAMLDAAIRDALTARLADAPPPPPTRGTVLAGSIAAAVAARVPTKGGTGR